jgi:hypothetical protein
MPRVKDCSVEFEGTIHECCALVELGDWVENSCILTSKFQCKKIKSKIK